MSDRDAKARVVINHSSSAHSVLSPTGSLATLAGPGLLVDDAHYRAARQHAAEIPKK